MGEIRSRNEHQPHAKGTCCPAMYSQIKADREALSCACGGMARIVKRLITCQGCHCQRRNLLGLP